ncbi:Glyoxylase, beta-lactamase superfamily II [Arachidicoccus rhizosphaerae]|uniref:Glyoxylase, beta-lactamase superfamily II n=1 Tax=Arachidicoccus rhizosphaerae TaxID=551991 RepID=A0A1H3Y9L4_9BACT|nr:MBL fold metallo-hydrolase [Arachidicoccus rhizosphaerae]SEA07578.1 Glyoxylase, beta-lactamase superfamily II [Arachidicoccus rhizosphaerae]
MFTIEIFTFNPFQENTYVLYNEKGNALIFDPGTFFPAETQTLKDFILRRGIKPVALINTHCHLDHVFGNKWLAEAYQLTPQIHPLEKQLHDKSEEVGSKYGLEFAAYKGDFTFIEPGDMIKLDSDELEVILVPGHSPGSLAFYCSAQQFVISGDALFLESIGRTDLPGGNHEQLLHSIKEKLFNLPPETVVYPGHGPKTSIAHERAGNPFVQP